MRVIHPSEFYELVTWPEVPCGIDDSHKLALQGALCPSTNLIASMAERIRIWDSAITTLNDAFELLRFAALKEDGTRRSYAGTNRAAQNRWPEREWDISKVIRVLNAWRVAGVASLIDFIAQPKRRRIVKGWIAHELQFAPDADIFPGLPSLKVSQAGSSERYYAVRALTKYGEYHFAMVDIGPPDAGCIETFCVYHNSVERSPAVESSAI